MICGIGIDVVEIDRIVSLWRSHHRRLCEIVFSRRELQCRDLETTGASPAMNELRRGDAAYLASRFAAKEATIKTLAVPHGIKYELNDIEITGEQRLHVTLRGQLKNYALERGVKKLTGSSSSVNNLQIAIIIGE